MSAPLLDALWVKEVGLEIAVAEGAMGMFDGVAGGVGDRRGGPGTIGGGNGAGVLAV